jgi:DnaD/phage-associated family protein
VSDPFDGFPNSGLATAVPNLFFARVLPEIESVEELIVTAYLFYAAGQSRTVPRYVSLAELEADRTLATTLARFCDGSDAEALRRGLDRATRRGSLVEVSVGQAPNQADRLYAVNTPANRSALAAIDPYAVARKHTLPPAEPAAAPDVFTLYEQNIGAITPLIADDLKDAEERYPQEWLRAAIREAAEANKRSWRYIASILRRWESEGPDYEKPERDSEREWLARRYSSGKRGSRTPA